MNRITYLMGALQMIALIISCSIGMWMTNSEIYFEQIYIIPLHCVMLFSIIALNNRMCKQYELKQTKDESG